MEPHAATETQRATENTAVLAPNAAPDENGRNVSMAEGTAFAEAVSEEAVFAEAVFGEAASDGSVSEEAVFAQAVFEGAANVPSKRNDDAKKKKRGEWLKNLQRLQQDCNACVHMHSLAHEFFAKMSLCWFLLPLCVLAAVHRDHIIRFLSEQRVSKIWTGSWLSNLVTFLQVLTLFNNYEYKAAEQKRTKESLEELYAILSVYVQDCEDMEQGSSWPTASVVACIEGTTSVFLRARRIDDIQQQDDPEQIFHCVKLCIDQCRKKSQHNIPASIEASFIKLKKEIHEIANHAHDSGKDFENADWLGAYDNLAKSTRKSFFWPYIIPSREVAVKNIVCGLRKKYAWSTTEE